VTRPDQPTLADKVAFLSRPDAYAHPVDAVVLRETHMSWVFLAGDRVYKLKKPVRFPYLDFSTLERREAACRAEVSLNRRLAPDVYIGVAPLAVCDGGLSLGGTGRIADWLVVMRRLDEAWDLEQVLRDGRLEKPQLDRLAATLVHFYRRARPVPVSPGAHAREWTESVAANRRVLVDPRLGLPPAPIRRIDRIQRRFVAEHRGLLEMRVRRHRVVDGHGDLRPEHIWLNSEIRIIDGIEFNARLRAVDPFDEIAFLDLECERLGAAWAGQHIKTRVGRGLNDHDLPPALYHFYRCYRATLRARLAIAHLAEPRPRTPEKWPRLARAYLAIAGRDAVRLEALLGASRGRSKRAHAGRSRSALSATRKRAASPPVTAR
jgi:aminoglycoside phosphotransferase family enzyme